LIIRCGRTAPYHDEDLLYGSLYTNLSKWLGGPFATSGQAMSTHGDETAAQLTVTERVVGRGLDEFLSRDITNKRHDGIDQAEETSPDVIRGHRVLDRRPRSKYRLHVSVRHVYSHVREDRVEPARRDNQRVRFECHKVIPGIKPEKKMKALS